MKNNLTNFKYFTMFTYMGINEIWLYITPFQVLKSNEVGDRERERVKCDLGGLNFVTHKIILLKMFKRNKVRDCLLLFHPNSLAPLKFNIYKTLILL